jgi:phosphatidylglycerol:prolipoprotein diacylglycerol transferase
MSGCYLLLYAIARIAMEFFREPDSTVYFEWLTKGQLFSILMMIAGLLILLKRNLFKQQLNQ